MGIIVGYCRHEMINVPKIVCFCPFQGSLKVRRRVEGYVTVGHVFADMKVACLVFITLWHTLGYWCPAGPDAQR